MVCGSEPLWSLLVVKTVLVETSCRGRKNITFEMRNVFNISWRTLSEDLGISS